MKTYFHRIIQWKWIKEVLKGENYDWFKWKKEQAWWHRYYNTFEKTLESFEEEKYSLRMPLLNTQINYHYFYHETPNIVAKEQDYYIFRKAEVIIGKDKFVIGDDRSGKIKDFNGLVESVAAYVYAKDNINEFLLQGKTKRELKKMDLSDLEEILNQRKEVLNNIKEVIKTYAYGTDHQSTAARNNNKDGN